MKKFITPTSAAFLLGMFSTPAHAQIPAFDVGTLLQRVIQVVQDASQTTQILGTAKNVANTGQTIGNTASSVSGFLSKNTKKLEAEKKKLEADIKYMEAQGKEVAAYKEQLKEMQAKIEEAQRYHAEGMLAYEEFRSSKGLQGKIQSGGKLISAGTGLKDAAGGALDMADSGTKNLAATLSQTTKTKAIPEQVISTDVVSSVDITNPIETEKTRAENITTKLLNFPGKAVAAVSDVTSKVNQAVNKPQKDETISEGAAPGEVPDQVLDNPAAIDELLASVPPADDNTAAANSVNVVKDVLANTNSAAAGAPKIPSLANTTTAPIDGFRQRPKLDPVNTTLEQRSDYKFSETLAFADMSLPSYPAPVAGTYRGTFIFSDELAKYCDITANDIADKEKTKACQIKLVSCMFHQNNQVAQDCKKLYSEILHETTLAQTADSLEAKQTAAAYSKQVLEVIVDDMANATTVRDDINNLAAMNKEIVYLLNRMVELTAGEVALNSLGQLGNVDRRVIDDANASEASAAEDNISTEN